MLGTADEGGLRLEASYAQLPEDFWSALPPQPVPAPQLLVANDDLAAALGLDVEWLHSPQGLAVLAGNRMPKSAYPLAQAYTGHQFGHFTMLGDGRAILLGEHHDPQDQLWDLQYKGSGRTPYSRGGDGRAALGPMLREYLMGEAMHGLGIPTTRVLAVVATGEEVLRQTGPQPGALLLRVAASHVRVGTFQYAAAKGDPQLLRALADYVINRHYPELRDHTEPYAALLETVIARQAQLLAQWMLVGFIHGVMNTDNMTISGETIDYGPCAFMDHYDPQTVFSSIDHHGRYAYGNQPAIAQWNLARFAETLLPVLAADQEAALDCANAALQTFGPAYRRAWLDGMRGKLGLVAEDDAADQAMCDAYLELLHGNHEDFTNSFLGLAAALQTSGDERVDEDPWYRGWRQRIARQEGGSAAALERMARHNPQIIPRNHRVEEALEQAEAGNWEPWQTLLTALRQPYQPSTVPDHLREPTPASLAAVYQTFCGT